MPSGTMSTATNTTRGTTASQRDPGVAGVPGGASRTGTGAQTGTGGTGTTQRTSSPGGGGGVRSTPSGGTRQSQTSSQVGGGGIGGQGGADRGGTGGAGSTRSSPEGGGGRGAPAAGDRGGTGGADRGGLGRVGGADTTAQGQRGIGMGSQEARDTARAASAAAAARSAPQTAAGFGRVGTPAPDTAMGFQGLDGPTFGALGAPDEVQREKDRELNRARAMTDRGISVDPAAADFAAGAHGMAVGGGITSQLGTEDLGGGLFNVDGRLTALPRTQPFRDPTRFTYSGEILAKAKAAGITPDEYMATGMYKGVAHPTSLEQLQAVADAQLAGGFPINVQAAYAPYTKKGHHSHFREGEPAFDFDAPPGKRASLVENLARAGLNRIGTYQDPEDNRLNRVDPRVHAGFGPVQDPWGYDTHRATATRDTIDAVARGRLAGDFDRPALANAMRGLSAGSIVSDATPAPKATPKAAPKATPAPSSTRTIDRLNVDQVARDYVDTVPGTPDVRARLENQPRSKPADIAEIANATRVAQALKGQASPMSGQGVVRGDSDIVGNFEDLGVDRFGEGFVPASPEQKPPTQTPQQMNERQRQIAQRNLEAKRAADLEMQRAAAMTNRPQPVAPPAPDYDPLSSIRPPAPAPPGPSYDPLGSLETNRQARMLGDLNPPSTFDATQEFNRPPVRTPQELDRLQREIAARRTRSPPVNTDFDPAQEFNKPPTAEPTPEPLPPEWSTEEFARPPVKTPEELQAIQRQRMLAEANRTRLENDPTMVTPPDAFNERPPVRTPQELEELQRQLQQEQQIVDVPEVPQPPEEVPQPPPKAPAVTRNFNLPKPAAPLDITNQLKRPFPVGKPGFTTGIGVPIDTPGFWGRKAIMTGAGMIPVAGQFLSPADMLISGIRSAAIGGPYGYEGKPTLQGEPHPEVYEGGMQAGRQHTSAAERQRERIAQAVEGGGGGGGGSSIGPGGGPFESTFTPTGPAPQPYPTIDDLYWMQYGIGPPEGWSWYRGRYQLA